jgi:methylamine dehydrogenase heavy chain
MVTIWDQETLSPMGEVLWPTPKRFMGIPQRFAMLLIDNDRWLAVANFSPATSVTLIDLDSRKIINEIQTLGCAFVYPTGERGFSSLCADGRFLSAELAEDGTLIELTRTDVFFDSDTTPIYERPAVIGDTAYFPTLAGLVYPVDISGKVAKVGEPWSLVSETESEGKWAPGGIALIDKDDLGRFYILMAVSRGKTPQLMVTNPTDMSLEIYDGLSGEFVKTITGFGQSTPLMMHGSR